MADRVNWLRVLTEGVVIVASILMAFGVQAWWEWRQDRVLERDALERLAAEFAEIDSVLVQWSAAHRAKTAASDVLLSHTRPGGTGTLSSDSIGALVGTVRVAWTIDLPFANISALESSGQFTTLRNLALLTELSRFRAIIVDLQEDELGVRSAPRDFFTPYLYTRVALRDTPTATFVAASAAEPSAFPSDMSSVLDDREFENIVTDIHRRTANVIGDYDRARDSLKLLSTMVRQELGG